MERSKIFLFIICLLFSSCGENLEDPDPPSRPQWIEKSLPYDTTESGIDADPNGDVIVLEWLTGNEDDLDSYRIYRTSGSTEEDFILLDEMNANPVAGSESEYIDENITVGSFYFYFIRAVDQAGNLSPRSDTLEYKITQKVNILSPSGTIATVKPTFQWADPVSASSEYVIRVEQFSPNRVIWLAGLTRQTYTVGEPQSLVYGAGTVFYLAQSELSRGVNYRWRLDAVTSFNRDNTEIAGSESNWGYFIIQ